MKSNSILMQKSKNCWVLSSVEQICPEYPETSVSDQLAGNDGKISGDVT